MLTTSINLLGRGWKNSLAELVSSVQSSLVVSSPYVTNEGVELVVANLSDSFRHNGALFLVTDLSSMNVVQGATDPEALLRLCSFVRHYSLRHLPRLHAKVYIGDDSRAVITSGNLTAGGLHLNYEYGVEVFSHPLVTTVRNDITSYAELGASVSQPQLDSYCKAAKSVREAFRQQQASTTRTLRLEFERKFRTAEDELIRMRLAGGLKHKIG